MGLDRGSAAGVILILLTTIFIYYYVFRTSRTERKTGRTNG